MSTVTTPTELRLAKRMARLGTETAFETLAKARALEAQGKNIIHLEIGEPDFDTPANVIEAGINAIHKGYTHYTPSAGLPALRQAVAEEVSKSRGVKVTSDEVVIVPGGKPTIYFTFTALVEEGDEVIFPSPGYPIYESLANFTGAKAVPLQLREENDFRLDPNELADLITDRTKLIVINSPHNPTGGVLTEQDIKDIAAAIGDRDIMVLSDEIYSRLIFEGSHHSLMSQPGWKDRVIMLDGWSKSYAMTGWRLGYGVMRKELAEHFGRLMTNVNSCSAGFTQVAGMEAIKGDQGAVDHMREQFHARRDKFIAGLNKIPGFSCRLPHGAFYAFPNIKGTGLESRKLADALLNEAGVACLSGTAFGKYGEGYLRFSIANSMENLATALSRIESWAKKNL
ncbi:MAG TPA: pyridoxal phosphate-dependent aminotransferase [Candidatus Angelobacter sp.]|nr:pyridoxal phosphate-dependent aminotransferase [Candidatus Angelobacter sp.]HKR94674.1 pyridoxal phosphate-dependent aminotransferase [Candidatus Angelobacter sp.]